MIYNTTLQGRELRLFGEMTDSRTEAGNIQDKPSCSTRSKEVLKKQKKKLETKMMGVCQQDRGAT